MIINLNNKKLTDEEMYEIIKYAHLFHQEIFIEPKEWKKMRLKELKKLGKNWTSQDSKISLNCD